MDDEYSYPVADQRHRLSVNSTAYLPWSVNASVILFVGSPRPINITSNLDPFGTGAGRWLTANGDVLPKNGERSLYWDKKIDIRLVKTVKVAGRANVQGMVDVFNVFNTANYEPARYGSVYGTTTYLKPGFSSASFYQPRMAQVGVRVTY